MADGSSISVVIPCYNAAAFVGDTIRCAATQTRLPLEVIVVDDGSTDDSAKVAAACGPLVRVIGQANGGPSAARNTGVANARGEWVAFLDADDSWVPNRLERLIPALDGAAADVVCVFNDLVILHEDGTRSERQTPTRLLDGDFHVRLLTDWLVNPSAIVVRAEAARAVPFPAGVRHMEDPQFLVLLRRRGRFIHVPEPLTGYCRRAGQLTAQPRNLLAGFRGTLEFAKRHPDLYSADDVGRLRAAFADVLIGAHESAYWKRDNATARECRVLYRELKPDAAASPKLFDAPLYPRWLARAKDWLDRRRGAAPAGGRP